VTVAAPRAPWPYLTSPEPLIPFASFERPRVAPPEIPSHEAVPLALATTIANVAMVPDEAGDDHATSMSIPDGLGGRWKLAARVQFAANPDGTVRGLEVRVNGIRREVVHTRPLDHPDFGRTVTSEAHYTLRAGDGLSVAAYQDSGEVLGGYWTIAATRVGDP
jgi:hypothetical protein